MKNGKKNHLKQRKAPEAKPKRQIVYRLCCAIQSALALPLLLCCLCLPMLSVYTQTDVNELVPAAALLLLAVSLPTLWRERGLGLWVLFFNLCWAFITRLILKDYSFGAESVCIRSVLLFCFFSLGLRQGRAQRRSFLWVVTVLCCGILLLWSAAGIHAASGGVLFPSVPIVQSGIRIEVQQATPPLVYVAFFGLHRNIGAAFFLTALALVCTQCAATSLRWVRILLCLCIPLFYAVIAVQHCRSIYLSAAAGLAMTLGILVFRKLAPQRRKTAFAAAMLTAVAACVCLYAGFSPVSDVFAGFSETASPQSSAPEDTPAHSLPIEDADAHGSPAQDASAGGEPAPVLSDQRSTLRDALTLTERTGIWKAILSLLNKYPRIALFGQVEVYSMSLINLMTGLEPKMHMHNVLFQQLLITGAAGFLCYVLFLGSLMLRLCRCVWNTDTPLSLQILGVFLAAAMIYGMFEPFLNYKWAYPALMFCLLAGYFAGGSQHSRKLDSPVL